MSRWVDADALIKEMSEKHRPNFHEDLKSYHMWIMWYWALKEAPSIDIVRCQDCKKSHIDGKTTHYLWCTEWGRSTDTFGYCERGEREGE